MLEADLGATEFFDVMATYQCCEGATNSARRKPSHILDIARPGRPDMVEESKDLSLDGGYLRSQHNGIRTGSKGSL